MPSRASAAAVKLAEIVPPSMITPRSRRLSAALQGNTSLVPDDPDATEQQTQAAPADEYLLQQTETARYHLEGKTDQQLIGMTPEGPQYRAPMEMNRRLKAATEKLTTEIVTFRESSDAAARKLSLLTNVLIVFTAALVVLTIILAAKP
jgi:hypothetical protein